LLTLLERIISLDLVVGKQVGVISYNETPLKKIILNGITTISSDFTMMGKQTARLILEGSTQHVEIPFRLILRPSL
jgi:DNA-binding LacI/PurR family transcriptional regulator